MGPSDDGMFDCKIINEPVTVGTGQTVKAVKIGKKRTTVCQANGTTLNTVLPIYKHVPDLTVNLFSILTSLGHGWKLSNKGIHMVLKKGSNEKVL